MTDKQIHDFRRYLEDGESEFYETHISWVILSGDYAYKVKKPVSYSFLDFSALDVRKKFCQKELLLNQRLAPSMYLEVFAIVEVNNEIQISSDLEHPNTIDYGILMTRQDNAARMDHLLEKGEVSVSQVCQLATVMANFHRNGAVVGIKPDIDQMKADFVDMKHELDEVEVILGSKEALFLARSFEFIGELLEGFKTRIVERWEAGYFIDGHGDLHSGNIFLTDPPVVFDCIEFNDRYRKLDVLNEIAFLLMDLESFGKSDLSERFLEKYLEQHFCIENQKDSRLLEWYKLYRAGIKIKVTALKYVQQSSTLNASKLSDNLRRYYTYYHRQCLGLHI